MTLSPSRSDDIPQSDDMHLMTIRELRELLANLPDDDYIVVDGYEGGFDMPRLQRRTVSAIDPWVDSYGNGGAWREREQEAVAVWVLARWS